MSTITETCACGATFAVTADYVSTAKDAAQQWRENHHHVESAPTSPVCCEIALDCLDRHHEPTRPNKGDAVSTLRDEITSAINRASAENGSDTPDYILARYLEASLAAFEVAVRDRDEWYGFKPWPHDPTTARAHSAGEPEEAEK